MNYLAHALRFLDDPHRVAGACLPDWLRVIDRRARVSIAALDAHPPVSEVERALDDGVRAHHDDDHRFHLHARFEALTDEAVRAVRTLSDDPRFRASTIGHVMVEMLLDAALLARFPGCGERYYDTLAGIDVERMAAFARTRSGRPLEHVPVLLERFRRARFILDYSDDDGVALAMNGVLRRTGLPTVPARFPEIVAAVRPRVAAALDGLLADGVLSPPAR